MNKITIYGASDDLVEVEGYISDEFSAYGPWSGKLTAPNGDSLRIRAEFCKPGSESEWQLSIENTGTFPDWPIRFGVRPDRDGDPALVIDVPDGTTMTDDDSEEGN